MTRQAVWALAAALLVAGCAANPTESDEYASVIAERDEAQRRLEETSAQHDDVQGDLRELMAESATTEQALAEARARNEELQDELATADREISQLRGRMASLDLIPDLNREVERVCDELKGDETGEKDAGSLVVYDELWNPYASRAEVAARASTCAAFPYLVEVALGSEFGEARSTVVKWMRDVRIRVVGSPTNADLSALDAIAEDLNRLIDSIEVERVSGSTAELTVHFIPQSDFAGVLPQVEGRNDGFVWVNWDGGQRITSGTVLIRTDRIEQRFRSHLLREEVTQALGLLRDSNAYSESIFQIAYTDVVDYATIDETVIALLYRPEVRPGMGEGQLRQLLDWEFSP